MKKLLQEFNKWNSFKERNLIKPFSSLREINLLLYDDDFISSIHTDKKFFKFVRKKIFWILDKSDEEYLLIKGLWETENDELILILINQILLTYFEERLTFLNLCNISVGEDSYNSITAYFINSKRGTKEKENLN